MFKASSKDIGKVNWHSQDRSSLLPSHCPELPHLSPVLLAAVGSELYSRLGWSQGSALLVATQHYPASRPVQSCSPRHLCGSKLNPALQSTATLLAMKVSGKMDIGNSGTVKCAVIL